jgi:myo-inositol 2-dehydrogenase/D-chiro-inositol 1-dehydrogenase
MAQIVKPFCEGKTSRRTMLKASLLAGAGIAVGIGRTAYAGGGDILKVGLVGCGGRGTGAAINALAADKGVRLTAMADAFAEKIAPSLQQIKNAYPEQVDVKDDHCFVGFDAYRQLIATDVDVVVLALPSHFHCIQLKAAVEAGKHVFVEKPHAVDPVGVRMVAEACEIAKQKNLSVVSGLCWRYDLGARELMKRICDGAIGDVTAVRETYMTGFSWTRPRQPGHSEMEYQMRNWYNFHWLSGDLPGLTLIHSLDKGSWAMGDKPPVRAWGVGGRQVRTATEFGDVYDHHTIVYEYANGSQMFGFVRQQSGCFDDASDMIIGTKGRADITRHRIDGENPWRYSGPKPVPYDVEHQEMFAAIRAGTPINNGNYMATSTMLAVLGRMVSYSGAMITWEDAMKSQLSLAPSGYAFDADPPTKPDGDGRYPIAMPGITKFS